MQAGDRALPPIGKWPVMPTVNEFFNTFLLIYAGLFPIVNPIGSAPLFLGMTRSYPEKDRNALARRVAINSFFLLLGSLVIGSHVLEFFGITLPIVRIAGGMVVTVFGWKLLHSGETGEHYQQSAETMQARNGFTPLDSFYPLTMPLTVGPGSISVAITLGSQRPKAYHLAELVLIGAAAIASLFAIAITIYACFRFGESVLRVLGKSGTNVMVQLSAFIMLCIGVAIFWSGISALIATVR
jgi:multiple antibiotic resistance protein